jgi:molybdopterin synthase sulfur carrier subunit
MIHILFFAQLRENFGRNSVELDIYQETSLAEVRQLLMEKFPELQQLLNQKNILMSVNKDYATNATVVRPGDEVAFFPPVTGG